jgi:hypothetical protein
MPQARPKMWPRTAQLRCAARATTDLAALAPDGRNGQPVPLVVTTGDLDTNRQLFQKYEIHCPVLLQQDMNALSSTASWLPGKGNAEYAAARIVAASSWNASGFAMLGIKWRSIALSYCLGTSA